MWHFISDHISDATGALFVCQHRTKAPGGDSHNSFIIHDERRRFFVKVRPCEGEVTLIFEADGLHAIAKTNTLHTPVVICHGTLDEGGKEYEYLVLSHIRFCTGTDQDWFTLGKQLAGMHNIDQGQQYGWHEDNRIGLSPQRNVLHRSWPTFFSEFRIGAMLNRLAEKGERLTNNDVLVTAVNTLLYNHHPSPSLLHGDLWSGNAGFCKKGPVIFDPAVYIGDSETDIAMTELFGGFNSEFYRGYASVRPLDDGYPERKQAYQLYHILNHALLFGGHYQNMAKSVINDILKQSS